MESIKVLLIDDEEEFISTLLERLEFRGIAAKAFTTGAEALDHLKREHFDAVVADLKMPGIDGMEIKRTVEREYPDPWPLAFSFRTMVPHVHSLASSIAPWKS